MSISLVLICILSVIAIWTFHGSKPSLFSGILYSLIVMFAFNTGYGVRSASAAWDDCSGLTVTTGNDLTLDLTADTCSLTNTFPGTNDYINFNSAGGASVTLDMIGIDDPSGNFSGVTIVHDGGTTNVPNGTGFGQVNDFSGSFSCSAGCTVSGNYDAAPVSGSFSVSYTQNAGSGSAAPPAVPEISVSADIGGAVADGGTNAQGSRAAGSPVTVTYAVTNSGTGDLTLATATSSSLSNVTVNSIGAPGSTTVSSGGGTTTFAVQYTPTLAGAFSFGLSFVNDDSDENPFNYTVSGTATGAPEISVSADIGGAVTDGGTNVQGTQTAGSAVTVTYTVTNSGTDDLTLATASSSSLSNVTVNSIGAPGSTTVTGGGGTTTFAVQYTPTLAGAFSFGLSFVNDDSDENPFNYTVSGTATGTPEIAVSADIGGAVTDGGTNSQGTQTAGSAVTVTYTVTNSGTDDLTLATATSSSLSNVTVNSIGAPGSTTVTGGGGTTTFAVQYTPTLAGAFSFGLSFVNDDSDENPFNYTVSGTATGTPEIAVSADIGGAVSDGGTNAQATQTAGSAVTVTYTVTNSGTDDLTLATASSSSLSNVTVNSIGAPGSTTVTGGGGTTTFAVQYTPTLAGAFSFGLSFVNDDSDENPFNYTVSGTATGTPEIAVSADIGGAVTDGGTNAQGTQTAGSAVTVTYTVTNSGTDDLTLATATSSSLTNVTVNSIGAPGTTTVASGGGTTTFAVQYTPTLAGSFSFDLSFVNNDGDENPFNYTFSGTATGTPEIAVSADIGGAVSDGGTNAQGTQTAGSAVTVTYTVTNTGTDHLTLATPTSSALSNVVVNSIGAPGSTTVTGGGGTTTFAVQYTPTIAGAFSFGLSFVNDDSDENPFNYTVSGTATGAPEISVAADIGGAVLDGGTNGQGTQTAGSAVTVTYTVTNTGTDDLTLATFTSSALSNVAVNSIGAPGTTTVTGGGVTTTFQVQYTPTLSGAFSFDLSFVNNDSDENPFNYTVSGTASGTPEIAVSADIGGAVADGGTNAQGNRAAGTAVTVTYTVANSGSDDLTLAPASSSSLSNVTVNSIGAPGTTTVASGGGTTTFQVQYTPTLAGAFSFDLSFVNNDGDENPFNFTVSGTGTGAPEIAVSSSASGALNDGGTDAQGAVQTGVQTTVTYTVTNSGNIPLILTGTASASAASNVVVDSVSAYGVSSVPAAGSTSFTVAYTPAAAVAFSFELDIVSDDADEANFDITVSGAITGVPAGISVFSGDGQSAEVDTAFATPLSARVVDNGSNPVAGVTVTFTAPASGPSLSFAATGTNVQTVATGSDGVATSSVMTANSITSAYTGGGSLSSYTVTASASGLGSVSYSLTNRRDSAADIQRTKEAIAVFVTNRADRLVSGQPDIAKRLIGGAYGEQSNFNGFSVLVTPYATTGEFDFSLGAFRHRLEQGPVASFESQTSELGYATTVPATANTGSPFSLADDDQAHQPQDAPRSGFDVWANGTYVRVENNNSESTNGLFFAGVDYRFGDRAVLGIMASLDLTDEENGAANSSASGVGWMVGPYGVINLHDNLYADARLTYGRSKNKVNALGLFTDHFDTERMLMQAGLTGDFQVGAARVNPFARLTYFREEQKSYVDTLGNTIPSQEFDLGRLEFGPKLTFALEQVNDIDLSLSLGFAGIYDFDMLDETTATNPSLASASRKLRGRVEGGVEVRASRRGARVAGDLFYDGIGVANYHAYGGGLTFRVPF